MGNLRGTLRYARAPSAEFSQALQGPLAFLLDSSLTAGPHALDAQLREDDRLMLYTGSTCVLTLRHSKGGRLSFGADNGYKKQHIERCSGPLLFAPRDASTNVKERVRAFTVGDSELRQVITQYLRTLTVGESWLHKESDVQMRARLVRGSDAWWHLDRESVLGGAVIPAIAEQKVEQAWQDLLASPEFARRKPTSPPNLQRAKSQDELDQVGIDETGRIVLAELKYGGCQSVATFIYAAPIQLIRYAWAWDAAIKDPNTLAGLQNLLDARRALFPGFYEGAPVKVDSSLRAVIAFGDPLRSSAELQAKFWAAVRCAQVHLPDSVATKRIEVWNIAADGTAVEVMPA